MELGNKRKVSKLPKRKMKPKMVTLEELGLPTWEDIVYTLFRTRSMEAAKAIAHWVHTPDCCPHSRDLIRDALKFDGSIQNNRDAQLLFDCAFCCDSGRIVEDGGWVDCNHCKDR